MTGAALGGCAGRRSGGCGWAHRRRDLDRYAAWHLSPPRVRLEHALLDVAIAQPRPLDGIAELTDAVGAGLTTPERLRRAPQERTRTPDRVWWQRLLDDLEAGTHSVLEHGYLTLVERPHGLPRGVRQVRRSDGGRITFSDVEYDRFGVRVELDGLAWHQGRRQRERDLDRDLIARAGGEEVLRLGWGHVFERSCWAAGLMIRALRARGWDGVQRPCSPTCTAADALAA